MVLLKYCTVFVAVLVDLCYSDGTFDVTKYGADLRGKAKSTDAISRAIDAAVSSGGGVVHFPKGQYLSGPIHLKSNITLDFEDGTELFFSTNFDDYLPMVTMRWEGTVFNNFSPLIYGYKAENIAIRGKAVLDGNGKVWWDMWKKLSDTYHKTKTRPEPYQQEFLKNNNLTALAEVTDDMSRIDVGFLRPVFLQPFQSKNIVIEGVTLRNSPFWNINPVFCENITISNVRIEAPEEGKNTDGIDPDSCKDVLITGVVIDVGDDCIAVKSGRDKQGRDYGIPSQNIIIEKSTMLRGHGVSIGSEQSGGIRNITFRDNVFNGTETGCRIKATRGRGGIVENVTYKDITMTKIKHQAITVSMSYDNSKAESFSDRTPVFRNLTFEDIRGDAKISAELSGLEESLLKNIRLIDVHINSETGLSAKYAESIDTSFYSQGVN